MRKLFCTIAAVAMLAGCAAPTKRAVDAGATSALRNQTLAVTVRPMPDFAAMTAGKAAFAVLGALAMISEGNRLVALHKLPDPGVAIAGGAAGALEAAHAMRLVQPPVAVSGTDPAAMARAARGKARYLLDVETRYWGYGYFSTDWTHYAARHTALARLIDTETGAVMAEGFCKYWPESNAGAPTHDELFANDAALLKRLFSNAASACVQTLRTEMLGLR